MVIRLEHINAPYDKMQTLLMLQQAVSVVTTGLESLEMRVWMDGVKG